MNKTVVSVGALLAVVAGGYGANAYLVKSVSNEVPKSVLTALNSIDSGFLQAQRVTSHVEGNQIEEAYRLYFVIDGERLDDSPLYVTHKAEVGTFGLNVTGEFSIQKDKGIAQKFIEEVTTFNEDLSYVYSTTTQTFDLDALLNVGSIKKSGELFEMGDIKLKVSATADSVEANASFPSLDVSTRNESMAMTNLAYEYTRQLDSLAQTANVSLDSFNFKNERSQESVTLSNVSLNSSLSEGEKATLLTNLAAKNVSLQLGHVGNFDFDVKFDAAIDGIQTGLLTEFRDSFKHDQGYEAEERQEQLLRELVGAGITANKLSLKVNDSTIDGNMALKPFDYSHVSDRRMQQALASNVSSKVSIVLGTATLNTFPPLRGLVSAYFNQEPNGNYSATFELVNGQPMLNGAPL